MSLVGVAAVVAVVVVVVAVAADDVAEDEIIFGSILKLFSFSMKFHLSRLFACLGSAGQFDKFLLFVK